MNIYCAGFSFEMTTEELTRLFSAFGTVARTTIVKDKETGQSKGFGFIEMENDEEAAKAIGAVNGITIGGRKIVVQVARPRRGGVPRFKDGLKE